MMNDFTTHGSCLQGIKLGGRESTLLLSPISCADPPVRPAVSLETEHVKATAAFFLVFRPAHVS